MCYGSCLLSSLLLGRVLVASIYMPQFRLRSFPHLFSLFSTQSVLKNKDYDESKVDQWINDICENTIEFLYEFNLPFKYVGALCGFGCVGGLGMC